MNDLVTIIRNSTEENEKELKKSLLGLNSIKEIIEKNNEFNFDIKMEFNFNTKLLEVTYEIKNATSEISVYFKVDYTAFARESLDISTSLIKYGNAYFNNEDLKFNAGDFEGDNYVGIKAYIESLFEEDEELQFSIVDENLEEEI